MDTLLKPLLVREVLLERGVHIFTPRDFARIFNTSSIKTKYFLETQTDSGLFIRLKNGLYGLKTDLPSEEEIANALYKPSYISFEYALAYYNMIPEMPYTVTCATTKPTRVFTIDNKMSFAYYTIKLEAYAGYTLIKSNRSLSEKNTNLSLSEMTFKNSGMKSFLIAEPEKALVDYLYFISIGKRLENDRLFYKKNLLNKKKLLEYAKLYGRKKLITLVKKFT